MSVLRSGLVTAVLLMATALPSAKALAQEGEAASAIPPQIPTSAFASRSELSGARLSPDGNLVAFATHRAGNTYIMIYHAGTHEFVSGADLGGDLDYNWFRWAGNSRIIFSMTHTASNDEYQYTRLNYFDIGSNRIFPLVLTRMGYDGDNIVHIDPDGDYVLASMARGAGLAASVYRFDLGGEEQPDAQRVLQGDRRANSWLADETGTVRIGISYVGHYKFELSYRPDGNAEFAQSSVVRGDDEDETDLWDFMGLRSGSDVGYSIAVPPGSDRRALMEFNFATGEPGDIVFQSPDRDVSGVTFDRSNVPIAVSYSGEDFTRAWIDPEIAQYQRDLEQALPDSWVTILDISADRSRMLVRQSDPAYPGGLYIFTTAELRLEPFIEYRPGLNPAYLATPRSVRYEARDGTTIQAILTLPRGRAAEGLPLVMLPHGGPYGVMDREQYDDWAQLLANRGYAVFQPNYRGSGGFGEAFERLGDGQIGRMMQDDLDDGVAYLVGEGIVDPARVCIAGGSYGGFAAMWGVIRNPEIYRCGASWAGVSHWERLLSYDRYFLYGRNERRWTERIDGDQTGFDLDDVSPAVQVGRLTRPLLIAHGEEDGRVPFNQHELMVDRAEDADIEIETLELEESGHSFSSSEDEQAFFDALVDFLARHNPAD